MMEADIRNISKNGIGAVMSACDLQKYMLI